jgi:hypothetical protein
MRDLVHAPWLLGVSSVRSLDGRRIRAAFAEQSSGTRKRLALAFPIGTKGGAPAAAVIVFFPSGAAWKPMARLMGCIAIELIPKPWEAG